MATKMVTPSYYAITFFTMSSIPSVRAVTYEVIFIIQWPTCSAILARRTLTWALRYKEQLISAKVGCHTLHFAFITTLIKLSKEKIYQLTITSRS